MERFKKYIQDVHGSHGPQNPDCGLGQESWRFMGDFSPWCWEDVGETVFFILYFDGVCYISHRHSPVSRILLCLFIEFAPCSYFMSTNKGGNS